MHYKGEATAMAGTFEIVRSGSECLHFRLTAPDGSVVAVSPPFNSLSSVLEGITAVRENAATGIIVDSSAVKLSG
jgi:uncharacterized protein YegP (UPF0339 family)